MTQNFKLKLEQYKERNLRENHFPGSQKEKKTNNYSGAGNTKDLMKEIRKSVNNS